MPNIDQRKPGSFCWMELATTDQNAAKIFYGSLFGWTAKDEPMGPSDVYTMFQIDGKFTGAAYTLRPDQHAAGVPPHWMLYIAVENADASTEQAGKAGATVIMPPFDVMDAGRMSVLRDPTGAHFCIWQPLRSTGIQLSGEPGTLCWADLNTPDPAAAKKFYGDLFGWQFAEDTHPGLPTGYAHIQNGGEHIGGIAPLRPECAEVPAHWLSYLLVSDCDATAAKATQLGAKFHLEPMTMENVGRFGMLADPQNAVFAIFQPLPKSA
jgi:predicted enzyme related to lactoylglutathione lyase